MKVLMEVAEQASELVVEVVLLLWGLTQLEATVAMVAQV
jgi:hypothetical protein